MTREEAISQAAEKYRSDGYAITLNPAHELLPRELQERQPVLLATKPNTTVVVEVWSRDRVHELPPALLPEGWEFDVVVLPKCSEEEFDGPSATPEFTNRLLMELEELVPKGARRARFLLAWSAAEAAMRVAAQRSGIDPERLPPRQLMNELVSAGVLSHTQLEHLRQNVVQRNQLVHGLPTDLADPQAAEYLIALARELTTEKLVPSS